MKQTISTMQAAEILFKDQYANWSSEAAYALALYYEELEASLGEEIEFDPVAIRCDWSEFKTEKEALENYGLDNISDLEYDTTVIELDNGSILVHDY